MQEKTLPKVTWTGTRMELVELVYALHEAKCFGDVPLKELFDIVGEMFDCRIKNYYRLFWDIQNRIKNSRTKFLDKIRQMLTEKLMRLDNGERQ